MSLCLEAEEPFGTNLVLGVIIGSNDLVQTAGVREAAFHASLRIFPTEEAKDNEAWAYWHVLPAGIRHLSKGWFPNADWCCNWENPAEEDHILAQIVERFARFKDILPELDDLSAAIKQP